MLILAVFSSFKCLKVTIWYSKTYWELSEYCLNAQSRTDEVNNLCFGRGLLTSRCHIRPGYEPPSFWWSLELLYELLES